jgi:hypothetical protein
MNAALRAALAVISLVIFAGCASFVEQLVAEMEPATQAAPAKQPAEKQPPPAADVTIINSTDDTMTAAYFSGEASEADRANLLPSNVGPGQSVTVRVPVAAGMIEFLFDTAAGEQVVLSQADFTAGGSFEVEILNDYLPIRDDGSYSFLEDYGYLGYDYLGYGYLDYGYLDYDYMQG